MSPCGAADCWLPADWSGGGRGRNGLWIPGQKRHFKVCVRQAQRVGRNYKDETCDMDARIYAAVSDRSMLLHPFDRLPPPDRHQAPDYRKQPVIQHLPSSAATSVSLRLVGPAVVCGACAGAVGVSFCHCPPWPRLPQRTLGHRLVCPGHRAEGCVGRSAGGSDAYSAHTGCLWPGRRPGRSHWQLLSPVADQWKKKTSEEVSRAVWSWHNQRSHFTHLGCFNHIKLHNLSIPNTAEEFPGVVLLDSSLRRQKKDNENKGWIHSYFKYLINLPRHYLNISLPAHSNDIFPET